MTGTLGLNIPSVSDCGAQASHGEAGVTSQHPFCLCAVGAGRWSAKAVSTSTGRLCLREAGLVRFQNKWALYGFSERKKNCLQKLEDQLSLWAPTN